MLAAGTCLVSAPFLWQKLAFCIIIILIISINNGSSCISISIISIICFSIINIIIMRIVWLWQWKIPGFFQVFCQALALKKLHLIYTDKARAFRTQPPLMVSKIFSIKPAGAPSISHISRMLESDWISIKYMMIWILQLISHSVAKNNAALVCHHLIECYSTLIPQVCLFTTLFWGNTRVKTLSFRQSLIRFAGGLFFISVYVMIIYLLNETSVTQKFTLQVFISSPSNNVCLGSLHVARSRSVSLWSQSSKKSRIDFINVGTLILWA